MPKLSTRHRRRARAQPDAHLHAQSAAPMVSELGSPWLGLPAPSSQPGGRCVHPARTPVPAKARGIEHVIAGGFLGRAVALPEQYRQPPAEVGTGEVDMCSGCDVDCCSNHTIPINCFDAWRIHETLRLPYGEFLGFVPASASAPTHPVRIGRARFTLVLKRRADRSCEFLLQVGGQRRCGIHPLRPDACRSFPFVDDVTGQRAQPGARLLQLHPSQCPWHWPESAQRKADVIADFEANAQHRVFDREVLSMWFWAMGIEKSAENFFTFLDLELHRRMRTPQEASRYVTSLW